MSERRRSSTRSRQSSAASVGIVPERRNISRRRFTRSSSEEGPDLFQLDDNARSMPAYNPHSLYRGLNLSTGVMGERSLPDYEESPHIPTPPSPSRGLGSSHILGATSPHFLLLSSLDGRYRASPSPVPEVTSPRFPQPPSPSGRYQVTYSPNRARFSSRSPTERLSDAITSAVGAVVRSLSRSRSRSASTQSPVEQVDSLGGDGPQPGRVWEEVLQHARGPRGLEREVENFLNDHGIDEMIRRIAEHHGEDDGEALGRFTLRYLDEVGLEDLDYHEGAVLFSRMLRDEFDLPGQQFEAALESWQATTEDIDTQPDAANIQRFLDDYGFWNLVDVMLSTHPEEAVQLTSGEQGWLWAYEARGGRGQRILYHTSATMEQVARRVLDALQGRQFEPLPLLQPRVRAGSEWDHHSETHAEDQDQTFDDSIEDDSAGLEAFLIRSLEGDGAIRWRSVYRRILEYLDLNNEQALFTALTQYPGIDAFIRGLTWANRVPLLGHFRRRGSRAESLAAGLADALVREARRAKDEGLGLRVEEQEPNQRRVQYPDGRVERTSRSSTPADGPASADEERLSIDQTPDGSDTLRNRHSSLEMENERLHSDIHRLLENQVALERALARLQNLNNNLIAPEDLERLRQQEKHCQNGRQRLQEELDSLRMAHEELLQEYGDLEEFTSDRPGTNELQNRDIATMPPNELQRLRQQEADCQEGRREVQEQLDALRIQYKRLLQAYDDLEGLTGERPDDNDELLARTDHLTEQTKALTDALNSQQDEHRAELEATARMHEIELDDLRGRLQQAETQELDATEEILRLRERVREYEYDYSCQICRRWNDIERRFDTEDELDLHLSEHVQAMEAHARRQREAFGVSTPPRTRGFPGMRGAYRAAPPEKPSEAPAQPAGTLPEFWHESVDPQGRTFFIDHNTCTTTYRDPRLQRVETGMSHYTARAQSVAQTSAVQPNASRTALAQHSPPVRRSQSRLRRPSQQSTTPSAPHTLYKAGTPSRRVSSPHTPPMQSSPGGNSNGRKRSAEEMDSVASSENDRESASPERGFVRRRVVGFVNIPVMAPVVPASPAPLRRSGRVAARQQAVQEAEDDGEYEERPSPPPAKKRNTTHSKGKGKGGPKKK